MEHRRNVMVKIEVNEKCACFLPLRLVLIARPPSLGWWCFTSLFLGGAVFLPSSFGGGTADFLLLLWSGLALGVVMLCPFLLWERGEREGESLPSLFLCGGDNFLWVVTVSAAADGHVRPYLGSPQAALCLGCCYVDSDPSDQIN